MHTLSELRRAIQSGANPVPNFRIGVAALVFCTDGRIVLEKRGMHVTDEQGTLEGVGGKVKDKDEDLHGVLHHEIQSELKIPLARVKETVSIDQFLDFHAFTFKDSNTGHLRDWVIATYLCRLIGVTPENGEPDKIEVLRFLALDDLFDWPADGDPESVPVGKRREPLSPWTVHVRQVYQTRYGNKPYYEQA